ncbi:MAG: cupin domain-containing protein [Myxococcales bacterium]|nr:cupin domain-containing protein [Myxococcales bacterium]
MDDLLEVVALLAANDGAVEVIPSGGVRQRMLEQVTGPERYAPFTRRIAAFFDVSEESARESLVGLTRGPYEPLGISGFARHPAPLGCPLRGAMFLVLDPGTRCPPHRHLGRERLLVLEGAFAETDGARYGPGDLAEKPTSSSHSFQVAEQGPCVCAYTIEHGVEFS